MKEHVFGIGSNGPMQGRATGISKRELAEMLPLLLEGKAKAVDPDQEASARHQLNTRKQKIIEGEAEFAQAISDLVKKMQPKSKEYTDVQRFDTTIDAFRNGLDLSIRVAVLRKDRPNTLRSAVQQARQERHLIKMVEQSERRDDVLITQVHIQD
uniref:Uncharacterized protein n=1 Tax=Ditylenchus dipsaci TaxID=166011 RepID=A0A915EQL9_9BILA